MVERQVAFSILQLVALSLPAFAILLQMVIESDFAYTREAVPITTASMGLFIVGGLIILAHLMLSAASFVAQLALGIVGLGMVGLILGIVLIGLQTQKEQEKISDN